MTATTLKPSQIAAITNVNEMPGISTVAIGMDYAATLAELGYITIRRGKCYPTALAAPFQGRSQAQLRHDKAAARAALIGRWGALR